MVFSYQSVRISTPASGITRRILAHSPEVMLTEHRLEKGAILPEHKHPHVQMVYLLSGKLILEMDGKEYFLAAGDSIVIPSNINHKAVALEESAALDIFVPQREDYL